MTLLVHNKTSMTYTIMRFYADGTQEPQIEGLTLSEVQEYMERDDTSKEGEWFDGFIVE